MTPKRGFTLIELLVVILIISIVTGVALLNIGRSSNKEAENFSKEVVELLSLAQEQALLETQTIGVSFTPEEIQFYRADKSATKMTWLPLLDGLLRPKSVPQNLSVRVGNEGTDRDENAETTKGVPDVVISPNGDMNAFTLYIGQKGAKPRYAVKGREDGFIERVELEE